MLTKTDVLPDEVWAHLDPTAGRLSRRGVMAVWGAAAATFVQPDINHPDVKKSVPGNSKVRPV